MERAPTSAKSSLDGPQEQEVLYQCGTSGWIERIVELALIWRPDLVDRATRAKGFPRKVEPVRQSVLSTLKYTTGKPLPAPVGHSVQIWPM